MKPSKSKSFICAVISFLLIKIVLSLSQDTSFAPSFSRPIYILCTKLWKLDTRLQRLSGMFIPEGHLSPRLPIIISKSANTRMCKMFRYTLRFNLIVRVLILDQIQEDLRQDLTVSVRVPCGTTKKVYQRYPANSIVTPPIRSYCTWYPKGLCQSLIYTLWAIVNSSLRCV